MTEMLKEGLNVGDKQDVPSSFLLVCCFSIVIFTISQDISEIPFRETLDCANILSVYILSKEISNHDGNQ